MKIIDKSVKINHSQCIGCKKCVYECPRNALSAQGEQKSVEEVLKIVLQDQAFYEESGGGLTLSVVPLHLFYQRISYALFIM